MKLALIVAHAENLIIGNEGKLPWHYSEDLKRFKRLTLGHTVIMGRKTYASIGRPLPGRRNIVLSRTCQFEGIEVYPSLSLALGKVKDEDLVFVIGGERLYKETIEMADRLFVTVVHRQVEGDASFPEYRHLIGKTWIESNREDYPDYSFIDYIRK